MRLEPTKRQELIDSYAAAYPTLTAALADWPRDMWTFKPTAKTWSIHEQILHLADSEAYAYVRLRRGIAESGRPVVAYDQEAWTTALNYHDQSTDDALELFRCLRLINTNLMRSLPPETWGNSFQHPENGKLTLDAWLIVYEGHARGHLDQMRACYTAWISARQPV